VRQNYIKNLDRYLDPGLSCERAIPVQILLQQSLIVEA
jgi:hypothetical protein